MVLGNCWCVTDVVVCVVEIAQDGSVVEFGRKMWMF